MSPVIELPGIVGIDLVLPRELPDEERERRIRYARHELFLKLGDDIPDDMEVVLKATTTRVVVKRDPPHDYSNGDLNVRIRAYVRKLEQD